MADRHYEFQIAADPAAEIDETGLDETERRAAREFRQQMRALDEKIAQALAIDVPPLVMPELPPIGGDGSNVANMPVSNKRRFQAPAWIALAASAALIALIGTQTLDFEQADRPSLSAQIIDHLDHEPQALRVTSIPVRERVLSDVVNSGNASIDRDVGLITYAKSCKINGKDVPHLVMQGQSGPITLLLMPGESVDQATPISGDSVNGVILPVGDGSIAIIGERDEDLGRIQEQVVDSITWKI